MTQRELFSQKKRGEKDHLLELFGNSGKRQSVHKEKDWGVGG